MTLASAIYKEAAYGGHLLALGTASIAASAALILGERPSLDLLVMAYLFSFGAYMINRISDFEQDRISQPGRTAYLQGRRSILPAVAAASFAVGYVLAFLRNLVFFGALLAPLALAILYSVGSERMSRAFGISRLKEGFLVKNIAISFGWSLIPVLVGFYYLQFSLPLILLSPFIFLRLMVNTVFFDVRDVDADKSFGVRTVPSILGSSKAWRLMDAADLASGLYMVALVLSRIMPAFAWPLAAFTLYSFAYRYYSKWSGRHGDLMRDLAADGEYSLWGVVTFLGHI